MTLWHFGNGKGILTLAYAEQTTTQGMAMSHKWISYVQRCLFTLTNAHNPNQYKWGQQTLDITLGTISFLGLRFSIALVYAFIPLVFIILGFTHSCMFKNTTFHECFKIFISLYFKANFIRFALHSCMFKTLLFMNGFFHKIFISFPNTLYWWQCYLFQD